MNRMPYLTGTLLLTLCCAAQSAESVVKRANGYCYESSSRTYKDIMTFRPYDSLEACLKSGARLPNTKGWGTPWSSQLETAKEKDQQRNDSTAVPAVATQPAPAPATGTSPSTDKKLFDTAEGAFVKRTRDGVCLAADHPQYAKIEQYSAYRTMQDCVNAQ